MNSLWWCSRFNFVSFHVVWEDKGNSNPQLTLVSASLSPSDLITVFKHVFRRVFLNILTDLSWIDILLVYNCSLLRIVTLLWLKQKECLKQRRTRSVFTLIRYKADKRLHSCPSSLIHITTLRLKPARGLCVGSFMRFISDCLSVSRDASVSMTQWISLRPQTLIYIYKNTHTVDITPIPC